MTLTNHRFRAQSALDQDLEPVAVLQAGKDRRGRAQDLHLPLPRFCRRGLGQLAGRLFGAPRRRPLIPSRNRRRQGG